MFRKRFNIINGLPPELELNYKKNRKIFNNRCSDKNICFRCYFRNENLLLAYEITMFIN